MANPEVEDLYKKIHPVKYYRDYLNQDIRIDGRDASGTRPLQLNLDTINTAEGSAVVKLGNTVVVCGIKAELTQPMTETPDCGYFVPNVEFTPLCAPHFRPGAPSDEAQVCSQALLDILKNSKCLDLKQLCIVKEKLVWVLYCDIVVLNHDGCVLDAATIATVSALKTVKLPKILYNTDTLACNVDEKVCSKVTIDMVPVSTTFMIFDDKVIVDPTAEEENLAAATISIAICKSELSYIYKPGGKPVDEKTLDYCIKLAIHREKKVLELLENVEKNK